jgi:hypothetical protein
VQRTKEGLALVRRMLQRSMWRSTKERVKEEASLPPIEHKQYTIDLTMFEQQTYDSRYRACHRSLQRLVAQHKQMVEDTGRADLQLSLGWGGSQFPRQFDELRMVRKTVTVDVMQQGCFCRALYIVSAQGVAG